MNRLVKVQISVVCCLLAFPAFAGDTISRWYVPTEMSVHYGFDVFRQISNYDITHFERLAPEGMLFNPGDLPIKYRRLYAGHEGRPNFLGAYNNSLSIMLGHEFPAKKTCSMKKRLRYGITYFSGKGFTVAFRSEKRKHIDSFFNGWRMEYTADSVHENYAVLNYVSNHLCINTSFLLGSKRTKRLNWYGGLGISAGFSFNQRVSIINEHWHYKQNLNYNPPLGSRNIRENTYQSFKTYSLSAFIPLGLELRLTRRNSFNRSTRIYMEMQPGFNTMIIPKMISYTLFALHGTLGLRNTF